jgi:DNA-binding PadR family transcriptional regulator
MITLQKKQIVKVHQVAMELLTKTKESPFIAILILAKEYDGYVSNENLREDLFPNLPIRACSNLLNRLVKEGYFEEEYDNYFELTEKGQESAADKSMWVGEKGIYNVYSTETPFSEQRIIGIEPVKNKTIDDRDQKPQRVSNELSSYENQEIYLKGTEYRIEKIDNKCFQLPDENWILKLSAAPKQKVNLSIKGKEITELGQEMEFDFEVLQSNILSKNFGHSYSEGYVLSPFDNQNTNFVREIKIEQPFFLNEVFEPTNLKDIKHCPSTKQDAQNWYLHLLTNNIQKYFLSDSEFDTHSNAHTQLFQSHFNLTAKKRAELIKELSKDKGTFYQRAKLETIDYLNF